MVAKPDPQAFRLVLDHLGLTGRDVLFTDDSTEKLAGAAAVGMAVHHFVGAETLRRELAARGLLAGGVPDQRSSSPSRRFRPPGHRADGPWPCPCAQGRRSARSAPRRIFPASSRSGSVTYSNVRGIL